VIIYERRFKGFEVLYFSTSATTTQLLIYIKNQRDATWQYVY